MRKASRGNRPQPSASSPTFRARRSVSAPSPKDPYCCERGDEFTITVEDVAGRPAPICGTTYKGLPGDVSKGERILVNDGKVALEVVDVDGPGSKTIVIEGGMISDHKGINLPGAAVNVPALSKKDIEDLRFALRMGADMVALSFVRNANESRTSTG